MSEHSRSAISVMGLTWLVWVVVHLTACPVAAQMRLVMEHPTTDQWLADMRASRPEDPLSDEALLRSPLSKRLEKVLDIGEEELAVERYFQTATWVMGRFADPRDRIPPEKNRQWRLLAADIVAIGEAVMVRDEPMICNYGSEAVFRVSRYLKGSGGDSLIVKWISGSRPGGMRVIVVHEEGFRVGEKALVMLTTVPFRLHGQRTQRHCPDESQLFYLTDTGGAYYESMAIATIEDGRLEWFGRGMDLADAEAEVKADLQVDMTEW
jgi:hypothetical protein